MLKNLVHIQFTIVQQIFWINNVYDFLCVRKSKQLLLLPGADIFGNEQYKVSVCQFNNSLHFCPCFNQLKTYLTDRKKDEMDLYDIIIGKLPTQPRCLN